MTQRRHYQLLCPIARTLDVVGDRWSLLILRDLHAGPARFSELQEGLGIATNLLSTRLMELTESSMIERVDESRSAPYRLTEAGRRTDQLLWELARFGADLPRDERPRKPGNLRAVALPLRLLLESNVDRPELRVRLIIDDDEMTLASTTGSVDVSWGPGPDDETVDIVARVSYEPFLDVSEGLLPVDEFVAKHLEIVTGHDKTSAFLALMTPAITGGHAA